MSSLWAQRVLLHLLLDSRVNVRRDFALHVMDSDLPLLLGVVREKEGGRGEGVREGGRVGERGEGGRGGEREGGGRGRNV